VSTRLSPNWWAQSSYTEVGSSTPCSILCPPPRSPVLQEIKSVCGRKTPGRSWRSWYSFHISGFGMCGQCIEWCRWWNWQRGQASTLSTLSGRKTMDISRINGSINDLHENGLLRLLVPVGGRATPPADISSPNYFVIKWCWWWNW
jgi:hypothetical protein